MSKTFEIIERVGISNESNSDAVKKVVMEANTEGGVSWFEVVEQRGRVTQDEKIEYQVTVKIGRKINA
ncbi:MAG: dodecin domain-containing protein [Ignavibacteriae bacterium]|nr:dodecin domain-containing protein [Ignavibacteriota bacterium]MCB9209993.1 dodecin domain-containing protein [Ignavibacteriales bacterium]MCB9218622.1 dodecin domain-containing protein [Ignavibacteriales bacterium]MCB9259372.1 dodecin domain-containing protein [Ignavibacteriales bacterium]